MNHTPDEHFDPERQQFFWLDSERPNLILTAKAVIALLVESDSPEQSAPPSVDMVKTKKQVTTEPYCPCGKPVVWDGECSLMYYCINCGYIAREMKKPCIIGTKIATKILKDGDIVEVDTESGVIRIIK
jgi:hypothetical protein